MVRSRRATLRLDLMLIVATALQVSALPTHAAEVGPGNAPVCDLKLAGAIEAGDSEKLSAALAALGHAGAAAAQAR